jgi:hypothetical protein
MAGEALKTSEIEGELLNRDSITIAGTTGATATSRAFFVELGRRAVPSCLRCLL